MQDRVGDIKRIEENFLVVFKKIMYLDLKYCEYQRKLEIFDFLIIRVSLQYMFYKEIKYKLWIFKSISNKLNDNSLQYIC